MVQVVAAVDSSYSPAMSSLRPAVAAGTGADASAAVEEAATGDVGSCSRLLEASSEGTTSGAARREA